MRNETEKYNFIQQTSGLTAKAFTESVGLSKAMGSQISRGLLKPSGAVRERLSQVCRIDLHWFLIGEGSSGLESDTVEIKQLDRKVATGYGIDVWSYIDRQYSQVLHSFIVSFEGIDKMVSIKDRMRNYLLEQSNEDSLLPVPVKREWELWLF
jgi:transcriptional regulator with XRE-family HTH domain